MCLSGTSRHRTENNFQGLLVTSDEFSHWLHFSDEKVEALAGQWWSQGLSGFSFLTSDRTA